MGTTTFSQNAYLTIYVSYNFAYANLAYVDSAKNTGYILKDRSFFSNNLVEKDLADYWLSYFQSLEKKWGWKFLNQPKVFKDGLIVSFKNFESEGNGVLGCKVCISKSNPNYKEIFQCLRKFSVDLKIVAYTENLDRDLLTNFSSYLEYEDVLHLDLNSRLFKIARVEKEEGNAKANLSEVKAKRYRYNSVETVWSEIPELLEVLNGTKYKSFLSKYVASNFMSNIWGNFLLNPVLKTNSELLQDFVRAYITVQLLSLCSDNPKVVKDFGVKPVKTLLWITGDLVRIPEFKKFLVAIIDGLQLRGSFDFVLDESNLLYTFGKSFSLGEKSDEIVLDRKVFLPKFTKVFAPDIDLRPDSRKVVFDGTIFSRSDKSFEVYGMSSEITEINIKNPEAMYLEGKFTKNAYIENYRKLFEFYCVNNDIYWEKIVFDCRIKPVVYGPNAKANDIKFNMWLSGESYS